MSPKPEILERVAQVVRNVMNAPGVAMGADTTALDVDGWDSLSNTILMLEVEKEFGVRLPLGRIPGLRNLGELAELVGEQMNPTGEDRP